MTAIATATPTAATPAPLQPRYDPLAGDDRRTNQEWLRRNAATFSWGNGDHAEAQEIDPRYRERSYSFRDILESVNPIQHLPIVGQMYRDATGTQLHPIARILGGAATGPVGAVSAFANVAVESATGRDISGHVIDLVRGRHDTPEQRGPGQQLAGGSWIYDPSIGQSSPTQAGPDPTANMAAAPAAVDPSAATGAATRANRRRAPQVAPPPPAPPAAGDMAAAGSMGGGGAGGIRAPIPAQLLAQGPAPAQLQPGQSGPALAQALPVQGVPAAQNAQARNIQQYFVLAGNRPPSADTVRAVPMSPPAGTVRLGQAAVARTDGPQPQPPQPGSAPDVAPAAGDPNDRTWFSAAMLRGVDRYRDTHRAQNGENAPPSVDRTE
jgi:hypothetical protein